MQVSHNSIWKIADMNRIYFGLILLAYLVGAEADTDCLNEIARTQSGSDATKALLCLNKRIKEIERRHDREIKDLTERITSFESERDNNRDGSGTEHRDFDVEKSPFDLRQKQPILLCGQLFMVSYDSFDQRYKKYVLFVNGVRRRIHIGGTDVENKEDTQLVLRFLEYKKDDDSMTVDFACNSVR